MTRLRQHRGLSRWAATIAVASTALLAGCGSNLSGEEDSSSTASSTGPIVIGVLVDQTAYSKSLDEKLLAGANAAVEQVNADGGVLGGRKIELVVEDTAADPQQAVQSFLRIQGRDNPAIFINGFSSAATAAVAPMAAGEKVPMIVASVLPQSDRDYVFSTIIPVRFETATRVEYLVDQGIDRVAVLHDPTPYNKVQLTSLEEQLTAAGITLTGVAEHPSDAVDLRPQITSLLAGQPQALIKLSAGPTQIVAGRALTDAGLDIPLILGLESEANLTQAAAAYDNVLDVAAPLQVFDELKSEEQNEAMQAFVDANPDITDPNYAGRGWDAVLLAVEALTRADSTDADAVREALLALPAYEGTTAVYDYTPDDHNGMVSNPNYLARLDGDGGSEVIFRPER
jgi:ABC-type branched-subunit amino acid transport system substrate-binding protein